MATWVRTQAPALGRVLAHCIEFLNEAVRQGAAIHPYYEFDTSAWFRHALLRSPLQRSRLVHALGGDDEAAKEVAKKLRGAIDETMNRADEAKGHIRSLRSLIE